MNSLFRKLPLAAAISMALPLTMPVYGQSIVLEEIIVTATRRAVSVQDLAISVSALSGYQLETLNLSDMQDVTQQIPNFQVNAWSPQLTIFNLRGVSQNNFVDNLEAPIAVYQDDAYIASINAISGQMFDVDRVEVLRGPQGTLFGRNATGGLVHYVSRGAKEDELNGYLKANRGSFDRFSLEGAVGGGSNNIRGRFAFKTETADGYIKADSSIPPVDSRSIGGADGYALRGSLAVDFSDSLTGEFILKSSKDDDVPTGGYVFENCAFDADDLCPTDENGRAIVLPGVVSGDVFQHQNDTRGFLNREVSSVTAKFSKDFSGIEFVSITNYQDIDKQYLEDGDAFPDPIVVFGQDAEITQFSQEFRLSGSNEKLQWQVGVYYLDYQFDGEAFTIGAPNIGLSMNLFEAGLIPLPTIGPDAAPGDMNPFDGRSDRTTDLSVINSSIFGEIDYDLSDSITLTAGLRYSADTKEIDWAARFTSDQVSTPLIYAATESNAAFTSSVFNQFPDDKIDYDDFALRLALQKRFSDSTQGFISWNRGIKGGNWSLASAVTPDRFTHDEEVLNSYEIGIKSNVSETLRINATAYYYDYEDYQTFIAIPAGQPNPNPQIGNSDASSLGAEVELFWSPVNNLDVLVGLAFSKSEVESIDAGDSPILKAELPSAPDFSGNYLFRYNLPFKNDSSLAIQLDGAYYGDQFLEVTNGPGTLQKSYNVSNLSLTYQISGFEVSLWGKNVFDEEYKVYTLDLGALGATSYYAPPQTYGVSFRKDF